MIDKATVARILDATNIVDVVSEFVSLRKSGANYKGLCPFHADKTPSFYVSPSRGICHCFSCGKGGNAVSFLMEHEQIDYPDAIRWLAHKYNIEIQERELTDEERRQENERESMFIVNEWAAGYFENLLHNDVDGLAIGMQYFRSRGFRDDVIRKFRLGFDPTDRLRLANEAQGKGYKTDFLLKTGICYRNDRGELIDRYAGRVIFPWISMGGKVVGFTARVLDARTKGVNQKYVNSPDSDIYHKAHELYGIYQAKKAMAKEDHVYLVEGQADVISMHQCGIENVVAGSGTALSLPQIRMLHRFTQNITLIYDDDEAGHHAALEGTDKLLAEGMNLKILLLPGGMDPDEFARSHTAEDFRSYIQKHQTDFIEFKTRLLLNGITDPIKRSEAVNSILHSIAVISDQIIRATYIHDCAIRLGINEATLISQMNRFIREGRTEQQKAEQRQQRQESTTNNHLTAPSATPAKQMGASTPPSQVEQLIIQAIIRYGERIITVKDIDDNEVSLPLAQYIALDLGADQLTFHSPLYQQVLQEAVEHLNDTNFKCETYFLQHPDPAISQLSSEMLVDRFQLSCSLQLEMTEEKLRHHVARLILDFRMNFVEHRLQELKTAISASVNDTAQMMELMRQYNEMQQIRNALARRLGSDIRL